MLMTFREWSLAQSAPITAGGAVTTP
jgi:hypothetical protein